jgi:hypothetical protein
MTCTHHRAARALTALLFATLLSGCYTAAPSPQTSPSGMTSHGYTGAGASFGSMGVAVFTSAPRPPQNDGSIWYYGNHPNPANVASGSFCDLQGSHHHDYPPYQNHRYVFNDGHYFWVGDAKPYASSDRSYVYYGHHPHPHYFGGTCRIRGHHKHGYAPQLAEYYRMKDGSYFFTGKYGSDYYANRTRYDARGWTVDHRAHGYREHELARQKAQAGVSPFFGVDTAERSGLRPATPQELAERLHERSRDAEGSAPANAAE